jgi:hypothetical protein
MKAIQLLVNSQLPPDLRDYNREFDSKSLGSLMAEVARKYPDQYERISKAISDIGRKASYFQGESLTLADNRPVIDRDKMLVEMDNEIEDAKKNSADKEDFENKKIEIWSKFNDKIQKETAREALARKNNLAYSVMSGARGKPAQLKMMLSTPGLYTDAQDNIIPLFVRTSFAEGLRPAEYLAGTYGARKSVLCLQEDTLVRMADGSSLPIKHTKPGMFVLGADKEGNTFPVRVVRVYSQGLQPVYRYTFRRGCGEGRHEVICTNKHAFLQNDYKTYNQAYNRFKKGKAPRPSAELIHKKSVYPIGEKRSRQAVVLAGGMQFNGRKEPYALMLGLLTGDGCLTDSNLRIRLSCADESLIDDLAAYAHSLNLKISDRRSADNFDWEIVAANYTASDNKSIQKGVQGFVAEARMPHKQILIDEGLAFHGAETKNLPTNIYKWDSESTAAYIAGLLATDGSIYFDAATGYPRVSFAMTAKDVIFGLHKLLQHRFGVYGTEISFRDEGGFGDSTSLRKNRLWEFSITTDTGVKRLLSVLPPIPGCKEAKRQQALLNKLKQKNPYPKARLEFIKEEGLANCYDIEVDHPDHLFVLDSGLITSNSTKRATAKGGDLAKQMVQSAANLVVAENDCGAANGIDLESDDKSLRGRVLARDLGNVPAGTVLDKSALASIRKQGFEKIIVRSPMTCQAKEGVCAKCMGLNALGKFPAKGEAVGITAAQAIGEPICLHEDTLVRMADLSNKKIKDIVPGDMVLGSDMLGNLTPTRVVNVFHNGIRDGVRTKIKKGFGPKSEIIELISTKEHKVLSYQGLAVNKATPVIQPIAKKYYRHFVYLSKGLVGEYGADEPLADILGILIGDGCYTSGGSSGISLSCYDEVLEEYVRSKLDSVGLNLAVTATGEFRLSMKDQYSSFETIDGTLVRNTIKAKLIKEGMWGQDSGTKVLPSSIATWNNKSVASLIGGLIATDGWICRQKNNKNSITVGFGSNSLPLLQGVKDLLEIRFGIYSSRITGKHKKKANGELYATNYTLTVSGIPNIIELQKQISIPGCKQEKLNSYICDVTSTAGHRGRYSVISQEPIGKIDTWDIEVANDTHLFCLHNSLIVSNTQGALNVKHQGGAAGTDRRYAGFSVINQFVQTPDTFPDKAVLSKIDGQVNSVIEAPQGGYYVTVDSEPHYVAPGYPVTVKVGDRVEAGDMVSEGLADPGEVVELRGLGEGRKYYADKLKQLLDDSGMEADRRNTELMARAALDHLQITDIKEDDEYLPDDVVSYSYFSNRYTPPKDTNKYKADKAVGTYLQSPALHYTIGTKITPKIAKHLKSSGFEEVFSSPESPTFKPHMVRLRAATHHGTDWLASMHTSYLKKQLSESAIRGEESDVEKNIHFAPRLAIGTNFGENIEQTGKF